MREFLFRGKVAQDVEDWDGEIIYRKGEWVEGNLIWNHGHPFIVGAVEECDKEYIAVAWWVSVDVSTVGQFTGLPYENGQRIFEGDIVDFRRGQENLFISMVGGQWSMCTFLDDPDSNYRSLHHYLNHDGPIKKIGNIHDDPHLLRKKEARQAIKEGQKI